MDLKKEILDLKKEKKAVILAHFYQIPEVQDIADFIGDSLQLAQKTMQLKEDLIIFAGVYFMAETVKILNPNKRIIIPDKNAGCSLVDDVDINKVKELISRYPDHVVVTYVNSSAILKTMSYIICTSSNAFKIINSIPKDKGIIFLPDKNLGKYLSSVTGRNMVIYEGSCIVHEQFSLEKIIMLKDKHRNAKIIAHPECEDVILKIADFIGSTSALLDFVSKDTSNEYIVATEPGIIHQMRKKCENKVFIPAPPNDSTCACNECRYMKMITLDKILHSLEKEEYEVTLSSEILEKAKVPLLRMMEIS
ncbi:MAG: quinolinate synthase NadA [Bacteroidales bacterium]|nr:quinolinate synthase NadA [Bacteroidales bacterium]